MPSIFTKRSLGIFFCFFVFVICASTPIAHAERKDSIKISVGDASFKLPTTNDAGGVSLSVADLGSDHIPEIVLGNGIGTEPRVTVLRKDGTTIGSFLAYDKSMTAGVNIATCDVDGDGINEIIVAPKRGGGPQLRVFSNKGIPIDNGGEFVYDKSMTAGVNIACGDLNGDGKAEIVTMPAAGAGPDIKIWNLNQSKFILKQEFFSSDAKDDQGLVGVVHDGELTIANQKTKNPLLRTYVIHSPAKLISEKYFPLSSIGVASLSMENDHVLLTSTSNNSVIDTVTGTTHVFNEAHGSVVTEEADVKNDGSNVLVTAPSEPLFIDSTDAQHIVVNTIQQRLYAYENGILTNTFLVSTSKEPDGTPIGIHHILEKIPVVHYAWNYGKHDKRNYDLGWVPYNLRFFPHIYLHYAPWHHNFGYRMTHGCVNISLEHMKWLYAWAKVGTIVEVTK